MSDEKIIHAGIVTAYCKDCKKGMTPMDHYSLRDSLWRIVADDRTDILCILCAEQRIGRAIDVHDFNTLAINLGNKSSEVKGRLGDFEDRYGVAAHRAMNEIMQSNHKIVADAVVSEWTQQQQRMIEGL